MAFGVIFLIVVLLATGDEPSGQRTKVNTMNIRSLIRNFSAGVTLMLLSTGAISASADQPMQAPSVSKKPLEMMSKLSGLVGLWQMQTLYSPDGGAHWQDMGTVPVEIGYEQKQLMLHERPVQANTASFNMTSFITYDQYRKVYRKAAIDDVWGVMDLYTGSIENDRLVLTNLELGTLFPEPDGRLRGFKLSLELSGDQRVMMIDATLDNGESWQPSFKVIYTKLSKP